MTAMASKFLVAVMVVVLVIAGSIAPGSSLARAQAATSTADAAVVEVCRFLPFSPSTTTPGAFSTVFAVRVTNAGGTVSDGPVLAGIKQAVQARQKSGLPPVTSGPLDPGQTARFKWKDGKLFPGVAMIMIAVFDSQTNPAETWENNMTFADPWAVPAC
jgi:hypothetical protein